MRRIYITRRVNFVQRVRIIYYIVINYQNI